MPLIQASEPIEVYPALKTQLASASACFMGFIRERETALKWRGLQHRDEWFDGFAANCRCLCQKG